MPIWAYIALAILAAVFLVLVWSLCVSAKNGDEMQSRVDQ